MTVKRRNFKIIIEDANLPKNVFLLSADTHRDAMRQLNWLFNRMGVTVMSDLHARRRRARRKFKTLLVGGQRINVVKATKPSKKSKHEVRFSLVPDNLADWSVGLKYKVTKAITMRVIDLCYKKLDKQASGK